MQNLHSARFTYNFIRWRKHLGPVHTKPEEFESGALFLRLGLPSTLIRWNCQTENEALRKRSWKRRNLKTELCVLVWTEEILKTELFESDDVTIIRQFVRPSLPQTQIQNGGRNGDCHVDFVTWVQLKPCYAHAHGCTQAFLPPVIVAFSNFPGVVWTENILSVF